MTADYRKGSTIFSLQVHIVWSTKYRYKVLQGEIALTARISYVGYAGQAEILSGVVSADHVHLFLSIDPSISVST